MYRQEPVSPLGPALSSFAASNSPDYTTSTAPTSFPGRDHSVSPKLSPDAMSQPWSGGYNFSGFSPRSASGLESSTEVQRRAAEWERQIEHLDAKELEIHQTQLRLIREQTVAFRNDFALLRKELAEVKGFVQRQETQDARWQNVERDTQRLKEELAQMKRDLRGQDLSSLLQAHDADLKSLRDSHADMRNAQSAKDQHHASLQQRVDYLEKLLGDSADKHSAHLRKLEELQGHSEDHKGRHAQLCDSLERLRQEKDSMQKRHSTFEERMRYLEQTLGDSADRHQKELKSHKEAQSQQHASLEERLKYVEKILGDSADEHAKLLQKQRKELDDHKQSLLNHQRDFDDHRSKSNEASQKHLGLEQRLDYLERALGDSAQHHSKQLMAHKAEFDQKHQAHASLADRVEYIEKWFGGLPGFAPDRPRLDLKSPRYG